MAANKKVTRSNSINELESFNSLSEKMDKLLSEMHDFRLESKCMSQSIDSTHEKIDELKCIVQSQKKDIDTCFSRIDYLELENNTLRKEIKNLNQELLQVQQYSRSNSVDIQGVPELKSENIVDVVCRVARAVRFDLNEQMIDAVHRLTGRSDTSKPSGIILKFVRRRDAEEFIRLAKVKRGFSASELGFVSDNKVFINQSLSKRNRLMFVSAKSAARQGHFKYVWFQRGKVLVRKEGGPAIHIDSMEKLRSMVTGKGHVEDVESAMSEKCTNK